MLSLPRYPLFENLNTHDSSRSAIVHADTGYTRTYGQLVADITSRAKQLHLDAGRPDGKLKGERVALLIENGYNYVVNLLAVMAADAIAVPLSPSFPIPELRYVLDHSKALLLLVSQQHLEKARATTREPEAVSHPLTLVTAQESAGTAARDEVFFRNIDSEGRDAGGLMLYTSGTTSRPKGVLLPTRTLNAQCLSLQQAWQYSASDHLLHVLPLHHIHGVVNALLTPLLAGSTIELSYPFNPSSVLSRIAAPFMPEQGAAKRAPITFFTAVPTVYTRLLNTVPQLPAPTQTALEQALSPTNMRLNISGSAALPSPTQRAWTDLTGGNVLLERYGMTEVGMALSCGLSFSKRIDGSVGWPLPGVQARLVSEDNVGAVIPEAQTEDAAGKALLGEVQLKGETIFQEYWENPKATRESFTEDGWFRTGDVASRHVVSSTDNNEQQDGSDGWAKGPAWFIEGRASADIIKTGGEKISALEVEREMLALREVAEVAVVGLPSEAWGQKVAAVAVLTAAGKSGGRGGGELGVLDLRRLLRERLAPFKIPQDLLVVEEIKRNAMGKVNKRELVEVYFGDGARIRRRSVEEARKREEARRRQ